MPEPIPPADPTLYQRPAELLQRLIRFNTTNPPGNEAACIGFARDLLAAAGVESRILAKDPLRPNLVARLAGRGEAPPILVYGHVDVVPVTGQRWSRDPFAGDEAGGFIWGRGALDMKGGVAMMLAAFLRLAAEAREGKRPPADVILALVSDEEGGGDWGAGYLVAEHAGLFAGVRYALGEFGGFTMALGGRRFYPIQVNEKAICWLRLIFRGPAGHAAFGVRGGAMARLGAALLALDARRLPLHVLPPVRQMIETMAAHLEGNLGQTLTDLLDPERSDAAAARLGHWGPFFKGALHNTVSPTMVRGGDKINVVPAEVTLSCDGRLLPGFGPDDLVAELRSLLGDTFDVVVDRHDPGPASTDMGLFDTLAAVLREADPEGIPVPMVLPAATDGRHFAELGIQTYGFTPMQLPPDLAFLSTVHAADERIPVQAVRFGAEAIYAALQRVGR
ncbi:MAG TPA: M20/M25/M40 family metallo-hydrolase [Bacillota bacterium]